MDNKNIILSAQKLCKSFSIGGQQQHILKNLDVDIYEGDFTVIMGSSGAGKSTLMYSLSGMDKASLGKVVFAGQDISQYSNDKLAKFRRKHCGFVFQQIYLLDQMSIFDNAMAAGLLVSSDKKTIAQKATKLFDAVNVDETLRKKFPTQISGGEAQRAGIVRALVNSPDIILPMSQQVH